MHVSSPFDQLFQDIMADPANAEMQQKGYIPVYTASAKSRIIIVGQAPGSKAQATQKPWNDASGRLLREWLGVTEEEFYNPDLFALMPMDFYYPGKGVHGDLPPRKGFAEKWHPRLRAYMPHVELIVLVGAYAQKYYLGKTARKNLTETVLCYDDYLPDYLPVVHPSPLNFRWRASHPWFNERVVPALHSRVQEIIRGIGKS